MKFSDLGFIGTGLSLILLSTLPSIWKGMEFMTGIWVTVPLPILGELKLGTPLLFDMGVFFIVIGVIVMLLFSLKKGT